jgi:hypothetical protein
MNFPVKCISVCSHKRKISGNLKFLILIRILVVVEIFFSSNSSNLGENSDKVKFAQVCPNFNLNLKNLTNFMKFREVCGTQSEQITQSLT